MPPNTPSNAHGFAMRSMSLRDMQITKSEKKILGPPLPNPGDAPVFPWSYFSKYNFKLIYRKSNKIVFTKFINL